MFNSKLLVYQRVFLEEITHLDPCAPHQKKGVPIANRFHSFFLGQWVIVCYCNPISQVYLCLQVCREAYGFYPQQPVGFSFIPSPEAQLIAAIQCRKYGGCHYGQSENARDLCPIYGHQITVKMMIHQSF